MLNGKDDYFRLFQDKDRMMMTFIHDTKSSLYKVVIDNSAFDLIDYEVIDAPVLYNISISDFWNMVSIKDDENPTVQFEDGMNTAIVSDNHPIESNRYVLENLDARSQEDNGLTWKELLKYDAFFDIPNPKEGKLYKVRGNSKELRKMIMYFRKKHDYLNLRYLHSNGLPDRMVIKTPDSETTRIWYVKTDNIPDKLEAIYKNDYLTFFSPILGYRDFGKTDMQGRRYETNRDVGLEFATDWIIKLIRPTTHFTAQLFIAPLLDE